MTVTGPGGGMSEAERDRLVELLREHFVAGQFEVSEFNRRVEIVLGARTADQAAAAVADLPHLPPLSGPQRGPRRP